MTALGQDEFHRATRPPLDTVAVPEWRTEIKVRRLDDIERAAWISASFDEHGRPREGGGALLLVAMCMADGAGNRVYGDDELDELAAKNADALARVAAAAMKLNEIGPGVEDCKMG